VRFKNIFSYGRKLQEVPFLPGVNLILGVDHEKERSNGSGKSSFLRTIPFALFGKTHKNPIKKENIINWKNRRNCEVYLDVIKNDIRYTFLRGLKPDVLKVFENGKDLPTPPDIRAYQRTIENEILNFDFLTFMNLLYTNLNDMTPILQMEKNKKREFLGKIFNLEYFTSLVNKANEKLKTTNDKIISYNSSVEYSNKMIDTISSQNTLLILKISEMISSENELEVEKDTLMRMIKQKEEIRVNDLEEKRALCKEEIDILWNNIVEKTNELPQENILLKEQKEKLVNEIHRIDIFITEVKTNLKNSDSRKKGLEGKDVCPTCGTEISAGNILQKIQLESQKYQTKLIESKEAKSIKEKELVEIEEKEEEERIQKKEQRKELERIQAYLNILNGKFKELNKQREEVRLFDSQIREIESKIKVLEERISHETKAKEEIQQLIKINENKIAELNIETRTVRNKINQTQSIIDYIEYIKVLCKDENAKQYAISVHIPYVNERTNKYLSDGGMGFYIKFDNWLEAEIKGPGIYNCTYDNLSGGEQRSIDLALQFAFLDTARVQATLFPDIMIIDEVLDSSIDSIGITNILSIIKAKQIDDKNKTFIVTHRQEVDSFEPDNIYLVEKKDGFSTVTLGK